MEDHELKLIIAQADGVIKDFDSIVSFYAEDATLVVMPGKQVTGRDALRKAFVAIAEYFNHTLHISQGGMLVIEGADTALVLAQTHVRATMSTGEVYDVERRATYVFKRAASGRWLCAVDNSSTCLANSPVNVEFYRTCSDLTVANPLPLPATPLTHWPTRTWAARGCFNAACRSTYRFRVPRFPALMHRGRSLQFGPK